ncbi:hypothetical protein GR183_21585 [Stappia sp. GBMRC 2046]|uniref:Uncharacterized protein n=1 Tax=Stappia sediminis TaxID=2692190 RepID=A0A7X3LYN6_9HYPH|nr:hypothetical protein [Stappia sediminis]MXN67505.1 hypothetical protein [Stappia sediminis]
MFLVMAGVFFAVFVGNVFFVSVGGASPVGDVGELILLMFAAVSFVVAILRAESRREFERVNSKNR